MPGAQLRPPPVGDLPGTQAVGPAAKPGLVGSVGRASAFPGPPSRAWSGHVREATHPCVCLSLSHIHISLSLALPFPSPLSQSQWKTSSGEDQPKQNETQQKPAWLKTAATCCPERGRGLPWAPVGVQSPGPAGQPPPTPGSLPCGVWGAFPDSGGFHGASSSGQVADGSQGGGGARRRAEAEAPCGLSSGRHPSPVRASAAAGPAGAGGKGMHPVCAEGRH